MAQAYRDLVVAYKPLSPADYQALYCEAQAEKCEATLLQRLKEKNDISQRNI